eukprot:1752111-Alexandrium_andersonii.AAC.1
MSRCSSVGKNRTAPLRRSRRSGEPAGWRLRTSHQTWEATRPTSSAVLSNYQTQRGAAIRTARQTC